MSEWMDIETAPKDGTKILGLEEDGITVKTSWIDDVYTVQGGSGGDSGWFSGSYADRWGDHPIFDYPVKWKPL